MRMETKVIGREVRRAVKEEKKRHKIDPQKIHEAFEGNIKIKLMAEERHLT